MVKLFANICLSCLIFALLTYTTEFLIQSHSLDSLLYNGWDKRTKLEVIRDYEKKNIPLVPTANPTDFLKKKNRLHFLKQPIYPFSSVSNILTIGGNESGEWMIYESDEYGFNNPKGLYDPPIDVALLGDSFTNGVAVAQDKNIAANLRKHFPKTISFGIPAIGPYIEYAIFREYVARLQPAVVLWIYYENDMGNLGLREKFYPQLAVYIQDGEFSQNLPDKQKYIDEKILNFIQKKREEQEIVEVYSLLDFLSLKQVRTLIKNISLNTPPPSKEKNDLNDEVEESKDELEENTNLSAKSMGYIGTEQDKELLTHILNSVNERTKTWNGKTYFVFLPCWERFADKKHQNLIENLDKNKTMVMGVAKELSIPAINIEEVFLETPDPLTLFPHRRRGHYNEKGYELVANKILEEIKK